MWANTGNKNTAAWRPFKTAGDNTGSNRTLQVGDVFKITVAATRAFGQIGFSLNSAGIQGSNYNNRTNGSRLYFNTDNYGSWYVNRDGGNSSLSYTPLQDTYKDYIFTIKIASSTTADVYLTVDGTDYRAYNIKMNGSGNIDAFSIYGSDIWDGNSNDNHYWKQTSTVTNSQTVELGYFLASGTYTPGVITDGLVANSTSTTSVNTIYIGGDSGSSIVLNQPNTYTGTTTVNTNATLELGVSSATATAGPLGTSTLGTTISNGSILDLNGFSLTGSATESLTINGTGISNSGALINNSGTTSTWEGNVNINSNSSISGTGNININGVVSGSNNLTKNGAGILTLTNPNNTYNGTTTVNAGEFNLNPSATTATFTSQIKLNGGKLNTTNITSGTIITSSSTLGLDANSTITLGANEHSLIFANSSAISWTGTALTIYGWTGTEGTSGNGGRIFFDAGGLSAAQIAKISFDGYAGKPIFLPSGELVPSSVTISSFLPNSGYTGTSIVITGTNFIGATTVNFGGTAAASFTVDNATQITAIVGTGTSGSTSVTAPVGAASLAGFTFIPGYATKQNGDYNSASSWLQNAVPPAGADVVILHDITLSGIATNNLTSININNGASLTFDNASSSLTTTTLTNNGTVVFSAAGTLNITSGGVLTNNATFTGGTGLVNFLNTATVNGSIHFNNIDIDNGGVTFNNTPTINGTLNIEGGFFAGSTPAYSTNSLLLYNMGYAYNRGSEWTGASSGPGFPYNVQLSKPSTAISMGAGNAYCAGNLIIDNSTTLNTAAISLNIGSSMTCNGTINFGADVKVGGNWTIGASGTQTNNNKAVYFNGTGNQTIAKTGSGTVYFDYLVIDKDSGDVVLGNSPTTDVDINTATSGNVLQLINNGNLDLNGRELNLSGTNGGIQVTVANKIIKSSSAGGKLNINGNKFVTGTGTLAIYNDASIYLNAAMDFGNNLTTIHGLLQINSGGSVTNNAPIYANTTTSLLKYNASTIYDRTLEWSANAASSTFPSAGYPNHVQISNNTTLNLGANSGSNIERAINGNLTIDDGSKLDLSGSSAMIKPLTVNGNIIIGQTGTADLTLSNLTGTPNPDLKVGGNLNFNGTYNFVPNNRAVFFIKNGVQTISASTAPEFHYVVFEPTSGSATIQLLTDIQITAPNTGNAISFNNANDVFDLNGHLLTIGTPSTSNTISGNGSFKGSSTSELTLKGNTSIGTLNFTENFRELGTFTIDRQSGVTALDLGTNLAVNTSLVLTNGLINLGTSDLTLGLNATISGGSSNSYVIADESYTSDIITAGKLRKNVSASTGNFTYPIGDRTTSNNGSNYTPAMINFSGGSFLSTAYVALSVNDIRHPSIPVSAPSYISRYWKIKTAGISGEASYTFSSQYQNNSNDIVGTETDSKAGRWNDIEWTEGNVVGSNTLNITINTGIGTDYINEIGAGNPLGYSEINAKGNNIDIVSGDIIPSVADYTDFGNLQANRYSTFLIQNTVSGKAPLIISGIVIGGPNASDFSIVNSPTSPISVGDTSYLVVKFTPGGTGLRTATITINNNDPDEGAYVFTIEGDGINYTECEFGTEEIIASQDFEGIVSPTIWNYTISGSASITNGTGYGATADSGSSPLYIDGNSLQVNNNNASIIFDAIDTSELRECNITLRLGSFSNSAGASGTDGSDNVRVSISKDNGTTWSDEIDIYGNSNAKWSFASGSATASNLYDGNQSTSEANFKPISGGFQTTDGYSTIQINYLPLTTNLKLKITLLNDDTDEIWAVDNIILKGKRKISKTWNAGIWSGDGLAPTASQKAIFLQNYNTASGNINACACEIDEDITITVAEDDYLLFQSNITNDGIIDIENNGSLVQLDDNAINAGSGTLKMLRTTRPMTHWDYVYWGSPVQENIISQIPSAFDNLYQWNINGNIDGSWGWVPGSTPSPGLGFIARVKNINPFDTGTATIDFQFEGSPNNGLVSVLVDNYDSGSSVSGNAVLLSNPYPSAIDALNLVTTNSELGTLYFWTSMTEYTGSGNYQENDYASWNLTGSVAPNDSSGTLEPSGKIAAGQGFFAQVFADPLAGDYYVNFNNTMRLANDNQQFFKPIISETDQTVYRHRIWLNLTGTNNTFRQGLIGYATGATNDYERKYDGDTFTNNAIDLYSIIGDKNLVIQGRGLPFDENDIVPLGYKVAATGNYIISIDETDGLFLEDQNIFLEDLLLNTTHDIKQEPYTFSSDEGIFNNRFILKYTNATLNIDNLDLLSNTVIIVKEKEELKIRSTLEDIKAITIYDILGRKIMAQDNINHNLFYSDTLAIARQTLIVKIELSNGKIVTKKVIF